MMTLPAAPVSETRPRGTDARRPVARAITEVLAPPVLGGVTLVLLGWHDGGGRGLLDGLVAATFVTVIPYAVVIAGVRRGRWSDRMLTIRRQRVVPILSNIALACVGLAIALVTHAPAPVVAFIVAAVTTQAILFCVNLVWKISFHAGVSAGLALIAAAETSPLVLLVLVPVTVAVCWARVELREHTTAQVIVGAVAGGPLLAAMYGVLANVL